MTTTRAPTDARTREGGFGSIEAVVAVALLAAIAAGLSSTIVQARRLHTDVSIERRATQLAVTAVECLRSGGIIEDVPGFMIETSTASWAGISRLVEARVVVTWNAEDPRSLELRTLLLR